MPTNGAKRYLYSVRPWQHEKRPYPEEALGIATYVENKERPHESGWVFQPETDNKEAIRLAMEAYGSSPTR